jgi:preprotein translocase subunit YajC
VEAVETRGKLLLSLRCRLTTRTAPPAAGRQKWLSHYGRKSGKNMFAMTLQAPSGLGAALGSPLVMMVIVMGIFYVMLILPQQRQRKKLQEMLSALKAGDKVITNGGIYGVINGIDGDTVILKIADTGSSPVKIRIARSAITQVEASEDAK